MSAKRRKKHLTSARSCRRYLADVVHRMDSGELDPVVGGRIAYCINIILKSLEIDEIEARITELEKLTNGKTQTYYTN
jgi:hypothetical protein